MTALRFQMTPEEEDALLDDLLDVLDEVVKTSGCRDMVPLWLLATRAVRAQHIRSVDGPALDVPRHIRVWAKSMRSKYAALASWRHAMLAEAILHALDGKAAEAVEAMYFTPAEANEPPYSWSRASSRHPEVTRWSSPSMLDRRAKQGCRESVRVLQARVNALQLGASPRIEARAAILETGARDGTLKDVLRYADIDRSKER